MPRGANNHADRNAYRPTEDEIREACRKIRAGWKDGLEKRRPSKDRLGRTAEVMYCSEVDGDGGNCMNSWEDLDNG